MYKLFPLVCLVFLFSKSAESQTSDSTKVNSLEQQFSDSIAQINEQNEDLKASRDAYNEGLILLKNKNYSEAIPYFTKAIGTDSFFFQAYFSRAKCYEQSDDNLAIADYLQTFGLDSTNLLPLHAVASLYLKTDKALAEEMYTTILSLKGDEFKALNQLGIIAFTDGKYENAEQLFTQSLAINTNAYTLNDRGSCYRKLDKLDLALNDYLAAIALNTNLAFIYSNIASIYSKQGKSDKAFRYYDLAISKDANYALAYNNKASLLLDENKFEKAKIEIEKALEADAEYAPAYNNKGVLNHKMKKYKEAIVAFDQAIQIDVDYAKAYLNRGISKQMIRDEVGACLDWKKSYELGIMLAKNYLINDCE
ncbi:tetratricopeptide repeat protein [Flavobacteriales bacterium]|nr:tetratricopeptide repeat protein [Flavobacteriales bacterium]